MEYLPLAKIIALFFYIILGLIIARLVSNLIEKIFKRIELDNSLKKELKINIKITKYLKYITKYFIYLITIVLMIEEIGISTSLIQKIFLGILIIISILIILSFKNIIPNLSSTIYLKITNKFKKGDQIILNNTRAKIIEIGILETKIESNREIIFIPNIKLRKLIESSQKF